ncbi:alpha-2-macroglobulin [Haloferula helveola]|uniref:Alpha-2-macroglobulin n=1 Tax=Haloferula helveola TaxID=490095 RepID=A0ABM7RAF9_9BACT|nr:alpha-2-macroglobulin [Haloferula helveola]
MKTLALLSLALIGPLAAAPRLFVSEDRIGPGTGIEIILDHEAAPADRVGHEAATKWLAIEPAWAGKTVWKDANVLKFEPSEAPKLGTSYTFTLVGKHIHLDGSEVPTGKLGKASTPSPGIDYGTMLHRYQSGWSPRTAAYYLCFNDMVDPDRAAAFFHYVDETNRKVTAKVRRATFGELKQPGYVQPTFRERYEAVLTGTPYEPELKPEFEIAGGLIVEPASPLPVGEEWKLVIGDGLPVGERKLASATSRRIGDIKPFELQGAFARTIADEPRRIVIDFSLNLPGELPEGAVRVEPDVPDMKIVTDDDDVEIHGDFSAHDRWTVFISDQIASYDGRKIDAAAVKKLEFKHLEPAIGLASEDESQLASGSRHYRVSTVNVDTLRVRVKQLNGSQLIRAQQGYRYYTGRGADGEPLRPQRLMPYELMVGKTISDFEIELENGIDTSRELHLDWDKVLAGDPKPYTFGAPPEEPQTPATTDPAALFLEITGTPKAGVRSGRSRAVQSLVQLTDLGMAWKITGEEAKVFVFSCLTGKPLEGVEIDIFGEDAERLGEVATDANGLALLPRDDKARHLRANLGKDQFSAPFDAAMPTVGMWRFPVRYSWQTLPMESRRLLMFSDRSLYRPGEEVHVKGIVRTQNGNAIEKRDAGTVRFTVTNPTGTEIVGEDIEISETGSFDHSFRLPPETTGFHQVAVVWTDELKKAGEIENWVDRSHAVESARFTLGLRVEEFRRNAFEISHEVEKAAPGASEVSVDLTAKYYHGQPLAKGEVGVWTQVTDRNFYPDRFRDHLFGDHRQQDFHYWYHYFGYRWEDDYGRRRSETESREMELGEDGTVRVTTPIPEAEFPMLRDVSVQTEVTDANRQTLTKTSSARVHPASVYVGVRRLDRLVRAGDRLPLDVLAVDTQGNTFEGDLEIAVKLSREVNEQVKMVLPDGRGSVRNDKRQEELSTSTLQLAGGKGTEFLFAPEKSGRHTIELRGTDPEGRPFATAMTVHVYGTNEYPWAYEDNMRIKLVSEKKMYRPGDTARVLVLSPIKGTALVTVERENVTRSFLTELDPANPVVEVPLEDDDAPNCYVSVLVIKGAQDSLRKFKEPQLRLGYCGLKVENLRDRLAVEMERVDGEHAAESVDGELVQLLPGSEMKLAGQVLLADGKPAANAEVTVYAEDEGTLAVVGYETPDPMAFFYDPRFLRVECGTSLGNFIPEAPDEQSFFNKGLFIGGGDGYASEALESPRNDFNPCAFWQPAVMTDAEGRFTVTAKLPDTLTRYRLIAVAHHGEARFGHAESAFKVNKPLMLEPQVPRFASEGDSLEMRALVQNASDVEGVWKVTLVPNPPASDPVAAFAEGVEESAMVTLAPGKSQSVSFRVDFRNTGEAVMNWRAEPVSLSGAEPTPAMRRRHADSVESVFQVEYPVPLMRQTRLIRLDRQSDPLDLLGDFDPALLEGRGHLEVEMSRSLLLEAGGAIDYLLRYPYGCIEQTTSSLIPWLAVDKLRPVSPSMAKHTPEEVEEAIQGGIDRLLSMQNSDGGFGYWSGAGDSARWASSYAGLGLVLASEEGSVPPGAIDRLGNYLIRQLRELDEETSSWELETIARDLWILALADKPQEAYVNKLRDRLDDLDGRARCFLALAEIAAGNNDAARKIMEAPLSGKGTGARWMRWQPDHAYKLLVWSVLDPGSEQAVTALDRLLRDRNPYGHWRTTWCNSWSILALAAYAETEKDLGPTELVLNDGNRPDVMTLDATDLASSRSLPLHPGLKLAVTSDGPAFIRLKLESKPKIAPLQPVAVNGLEVTRFYQRVHPDGTTEPLDSPKIGDLIRVDLRVTLPGDDSRYLVVEDRLPGNFEAINNTFESQAANMNAGGTSEESWTVSHNEIRDDRVMFFLDRVYRRGTQTLSYLARCTIEGESFAPPAKVEAMYDPDQTALSASRSFEVK